MEAAVFYRGRSVGSAGLVKDGLYFVLTADCERCAPGVQRLWGVNGLRAVCLGVLSPEAGRLRLRRRLSVRSLPAPPQALLVGRETDGWLPWRGSLGGEKVASGRVRSDGTALAVPFSEELPMPMFDHALKLERVMLEGELCVKLPLHSISSNPTGQWSEPRISE